MAAPSRQCSLFLDAEPDSGRIGSVLVHRVCVRFLMCPWPRTIRPSRPYRSSNTYQPVEKRSALALRPVLWVTGNPCATKVLPVGLSLRKQEGGVFRSAATVFSCPDRGRKDGPVVVAGGRVPPTVTPTPRLAGDRESDEIG